MDRSILTTPLRLFRETRPRFAVILAHSCPQRTQDQLLAHQGPNDPDKDCERTANLYKLN